MELLSLIVLAFVIVQTALFICNLLSFRKAPACNAHPGAELRPVSVLIPARDEADQIRETLAAVLDNQGVDLEVVVLDDHSSDSTAAVVGQIAATDARVRPVPGKTLPHGWCGKQYACHQLAQYASHEALLFLDADVRLTKDAIRRCLLQQWTTRVDLLGGFPKQVVGTLGEALMIPLMHIVMLTYLPFVLMRRTKNPAASAGCGQLFLTTRAAYQSSGGHAAIKGSLHDGLMLPRVYRRRGMATDVFDASDVAACRMYQGWLQTWRGLMKNAHEGIANSRLILPFSCFLVLGYVTPAALLVHQLLWFSSADALIVSLATAALSYVPRFVIAWRFGDSWLAAALFPFSILLFVALQWIAFGRSLSGAEATWRGRAYAATTA